MVLSVGDDLMDVLQQAPTPTVCCRALILVDNCLVKRFPRCAADTPTSYRRLHRSPHILRHTVLVGSYTYILLLLILSHHHLRRDQRPAGWAHTLPKPQRRHLLREPDSHLVIPGVSTYTSKSAYTSSRRQNQYATRENYDISASFNPLANSTGYASH